MATEFILLDGIIDPETRHRIQNNINYLIYGVEGPLIMPMFIAGYIYVYKKQALYHSQLLKKY
jgi:hypothetical protein